MKKLRWVGGKVFATQKRASGIVCYVQNLGKSSPDPPKSSPGASKIEPGTLQDAQKSDPRCLLFGIPFLMPLEIDFNAILDTNLHPKTHQNPPKTDAKKPSILGFNFWSIFDWFLIDFWSTLGSLWEHFLVKNSSKDGIVFWHPFLLIFGSILGTPDRAKVSIPFDTVINFKKITISKNIPQKASKKVPFLFPLATHFHKKHLPKRMLKTVSIFYRFLVRFAGPACH